jgi:hypothetical protein
MRSPRHSCGTGGRARGLPLTLLRTAAKATRDFTSAGSVSTTASTGIAHAGTFGSVGLVGHGSLAVDPGFVGEGTRQLNLALTAANADMRAWNDTQRSRVTSTTAHLQAAGDTASFAAQMNAQRDAAKADANAQIDRYIRSGNIRRNAISGDPATHSRDEQLYWGVCGYHHRSDRGLPHYDCQSDSTADSSSGGLDRAGS